MKVETWIRKYWKILLIVIALAYLLHSVGLLPLSGTGYLTGTQGLAADFNSVNWNSAWWSNSEKGASLYTTQSGVPAFPSSMDFGGNMVFDPDEATKGQPKLVATQQPILVENTIAPVPYSWNYKVNQTTLSNGTIVDIYQQFNMFMYTCDWRVNVLLSGTEWESDGKYADNPDKFTTQHGNYAGANIWVQLVPQSFVYFTDNPEHVYFAPVYFGLREPVTWAGVDTKGQLIMNDAEISSREDMFPKATGETCQIFYQRGGGEVFDDTTLLSYQGTQLDPSIFRNNYWLRFSLLQFYPYSWHPSPNLWDHNWKYPSAYLHFQVNVFVVGQWTVMLKVGDVPTLQPHTPVTNVIQGWFDSLGSWFSNPFNQVWVLLIILVIIAIVLGPTINSLSSLIPKRRKTEE